MPHVSRFILAWLTAVGWLSVGEPCWAAPPANTVDMAALSTATGMLRRVHGSAGDGSFGVPVAGGFDCDGDGFRDYAMAAMLASPFGRSGAGEVYLIFGDGTLSGALDTAPLQAGILKIAGDGISETTGSEIWMDDVTGDGIGDLLIGRQNYTPSGQRIGAGALSIVVGGPALRAYAATLQYLDLRSPPPNITVTTVIGANTTDRLGIWMRTGDVTGDGVADIVVGADQATSSGSVHAGSAYVIRGGAHLAAGGVVDLADFGTTALPGNIARILPPAGSTHYHFGATCQIADLDGNGRAEVLVAAALNRKGASIAASQTPPGAPHANGGSFNGTMYIAWDDNFTANPWPMGFSFLINASPGSRSIISGGANNKSFGEEIIGGLDYDDDGAPDLFVGDLAGDGTLNQTRPFSGMGHVFYNAAALKGRRFDLEVPPADIGITTFIGPEEGSITGDTALHGDFDGDGIADLAFSSPEGTALGRANAGIIHVLHGKPGRWPIVVDLKPSNLPPSSAIRITEIYGAHGTAGTNSGDVLCYSAAAGDIDGDGKIDLISNEMLGDGLTPAAEDTGNLVIISGVATAPVRGRILYYGSGQPVAGATVTLQGTPSLVTTTNASGNFGIVTDSGGTRQLVPSKMGDFRGGISALDAVYVLQAAVQLLSLDPRQTIAGDVTGNGSLSALDASLMLQQHVGLIERFPVAVKCDSDWVFIPVASNQSLIQPQTAGSTCQPGGIQYNSLQTPIEQQDFVAVLLGDTTANWSP